MEQYVNLHCHTEASPMDGYSNIPEYLKRCAEIGMPALAVTEHGTTSSHRPFQRLTKDAGIKPLLGLEAYFSPTDRFDKRSKANREEEDSVYNHLIIIAKNDNGLKNLNSGNRIAFNEGFYIKPRWDMELLKDHADDLIILSGCLNGVLAKAIDRGDIDAALDWALKFKDIFGDNFYIEIQTHNPEHINRGLLDLADDLSIKSVITDDCHHAKPSDKIMQEVFLILSTHPKMDKAADISKAQKMDLLERFDYLYPDRKMSFKNFDLYLEGYLEKSAKMEKFGLSRQDIFDNTIEVADKVEEYSYRENLDTLPKVVDNPDEVLREKVQAGLKRLGLDGDQDYQDRAARELDVITKKKFPNYFLLLEDAIAFAKKNNIRCGKGRGSAAGSLVCYALGITGVDPIEYNLLFERFLDEERADWPDIDWDIQDTRRHEIQKYFADKYGNVASITNVLTYGGKKALKDAARVIGVPYSEVNKVMKILNGVEEVTGSDVIAEFRKGAVAFNKKYPDVIRIAEKLHGRIYSYGIHAAGLIVTEQPIAEYAPMETRKKGNEVERVEVVGIDKDECESVGLIKMDLLGLSTLSVIDDAVRLIRENKGIIIDIDSISLYDTKVFDMLSAGKTVGVFQCDKAASTKLLVNMGVETFNDMVVANALVRPGAWNAIGEEYLAYKSGAKKAKSIHPDVESYMAETFYLPIYQEQMMRLTVDLAGFTVGESNKLRKGIGKKKRDIIDTFKPQFIEGASKKISLELAEKLWRSFEEAGAYAFNLSHAVAYSMLSFQTAWLKAHYPQEFMCAMLLNEKKTETVTDYLLECKNMGIKVKFPHINRSQEYWTIEGDSLRMGLSNVKNLSDKLANRIIAERPYVDYADFKEYVLRKGSGLSTKVLMSLNAFGGASFPDNPVPDNYKDNLYEYLNIPAFDSKLLTPRMREELRPLDEYTDDETFFVMGMVKNIARGEGRFGPWCRIDMIDGVDKVGCFTSPNTTIVKGQLYLFLIHKNSIIKSIKLGGEGDASDDIIIDFLRRPTLDEIPDGQYMILAAQPRKTKAGKNMATVIIGNKEKDLKGLMVWDGQFDKVRLYCKLGSVRSISIGKMKDGTEYINDVH